MNTSFSSPESILAAKSELRRLMVVRRASAFADNPNAPLALRNLFLKAITLKPGSIIGSYAARGGEMDPSMLTQSLRADGHIIALPVMSGEEQPLVFRRYDFAQRLVPNKFGIQEPDVAAPVLVPDILLVPLLAFDRRHYRLGIGGGYYDRTLHKLRKSRSVLAIGFGFACQEIAEIPVESHDVVLDKIATELQVF